MNARLGFAIAAHLDPGRAAHRRGAERRRRGFQEQVHRPDAGASSRGVPIVFVSHNLPAVLELCTRAIVIDHGTVRFDGEPAQRFKSTGWCPGRRRRRGRPTPRVRAHRTSRAPQRAPGNLARCSTRPADADPGPTTPFVAVSKPSICRRHPSGRRRLLRRHQHDDGPARS